MDIFLHNTLSHKKEKFEPQVEGEVSMYHCGPTVYNTPHIGNYRTFIMNDIIRRVFEYNSYKVNQVMNITDVDDKTIRGSKEAGIPLETFTRKYEDLFLEEIKSLNFLIPNHITRATEYISQMIGMIEILLNKEIAYVSNDGIYLSVSKVPQYGKLADLDLSKLSKERITNDNYDKDNARDFALWKFRTAEDGPVSWKAPFGEGRPGWHIECSAMSKAVLGDTIDIHTGGIDLIFPHHTNEIAQSECTTGKQFVRYWIHGGFINVSDQKMAKSAGNFYRLDQLKEMMISPLGFRYWLLTSHYRSPVNFTEEAVLGAQNALIKLIKFVMRVQNTGSINDKYKVEFNRIINDDFNMPEAIALAWKVVADDTLSDEDKKATLLDFDQVFGLGLGTVPVQEKVDIPPEIQVLVELRQKARQDKDWAKSDAIRKEIQDRGFDIIDKKDGQEIVAL